MWGLLRRRLVCSRVWAFNSYYCILRVDGRPDHCTVPKAFNSYYCIPGTIKEDYWNAGSSRFQFLLLYSADGVIDDKGLEDELFQFLLLYSLVDSAHYVAKRIVAFNSYYCILGIKRWCRTRDSSVAFNSYYCIPQASRLSQLSSPLLRFQFLLLYSPRALPHSRHVEVSALSILIIVFQLTMYYSILQEKEAFQFLLLYSKPKLKLQIAYAAVPQLSILIIVFSLILSAETLLSSPWLSILIIVFARKEDK